MSRRELQKRVNEAPLLAGYRVESVNRSYYLRHASRNTIYLQNASIAVKWLANVIATGRDNQAMRRMK